MRLYLSKTLKLNVTALNSLTALLECPEDMSRKELMDRIALRKSGSEMVATVGILHIDGVFEPIAVRVVPYQNSASIEKSPVAVQLFNEGY